MEHRILGIDENGLGPLLGPLVVTGTLLKYQISDNRWFKDITDSKLFFKSRNRAHFALIEETVISIFYLCKKRMPKSPTEIFKVFCHQFECSQTINICTNSIPSEFLWADPEKSKKRCLEFSEWVVKNNIVIENLQCIFICPMQFNTFTVKNTKLFLDFRAFCTIINGVKQKESLHVDAGKIGGLKFYLPYLRYVMTNYEAEVVSEKDNASVYILANKEVRIAIGFFMDVEKYSFPAALSSIIGKYIRELSMFSIRRNLNIKEDISGYYDRKTKQYINNVNLGKLPTECVFRKN